MARPFMKHYIPAEERHEARRKTPQLMIEGLLLGGTGLGVLALIFEIAADAFSVAAYQTLLAIHGAHGNHNIAIIGFIILSVMLFFGIVPAYKGAAYLRPDTGGSGPLVESMGPSWLRRTSWVGTSLFFLDAILTIIISSISAADVTMLLLPEAAPYRILMAELFAFFIMVWLVALGPRKAVPLFLLGGACFTIFTIGALGYVAFAATTQPELGMMTPEIIHRLESAGVIEHIVEQVPVLTSAAFFGLLLKSMSSAMLGFSGYEMIPASGKHAARPKWKVINLSLTIAAFFLISTGLIQLFAAKVWGIPSTEGYSTLLIEYELVFGMTSPQLLTIAGLLLAIILLLAQGGGYIGGAAVASNAARLGRLPASFSDDRFGIAVIWGISAVMIPIIRAVVVVEAFYAFGFVSAFIITSTTLYFVRKDVLEEAGIEPGSPEARSLKFAGLRGMIASYTMGVILIVMKTDALFVIIPLTIVITMIQMIVSRGGFKHNPEREVTFDYTGDVVKSERTGRIVYLSGEQRAHDEARQRGFIKMVVELLESGDLQKYGVSPRRIKTLLSHEHGIPRNLWPVEEDHKQFINHILPEPSLELQKAFDDAYLDVDSLTATLSHYNYHGVFKFINEFYPHWVNEKRSSETIQKVMLKAFFGDDRLDEMWEIYQDFDVQFLPEVTWQFARQRYQWAKDVWPNLSDRVTTVWTLEDLDLVSDEKARRFLGLI